MFTRTAVPEPQNEPLLNFAPGSKEALAIAEACAKLRKECIEIPCIIDGKEIRSGDVSKQTLPSDHSHVLCTFHQATEQMCEQAVQSALSSKSKWESLSFEDRASIFLRAAELVATKYRYEILAATMLGQGKTVWQAEIDAAGELIDFLRFNVFYAQEIYKQQPIRNSKATWNQLEYRPLEGFVLAISPFNFTAIGANLCTAPALMGNVVIWKPAPTAMLSNYTFYKVLLEAGLPAGVINFLPGDAPLIADNLLNSKHFSGLHFTGSTNVFNSLIVKSSTNLSKRLYLTYPRIVGETGGKDFHFVHPSADPKLVLNLTIRGAFEFQGQKCSACSRLYVPDQMWESSLKQDFKTELGKIKVGQPDDLKNFMSAVIDERSFKKISEYIQHAKKSDECEIIFGGECDGEKGYFINPTIVQVTNPKNKLMEEEIFGPVLTVYVYKEKDYVDALKICNDTSPYGLTGSIFARDAEAISVAKKELKNACGNFYVNDKCTGAVVGQQPFGGARASGTNDKAGSALNLLRWVSPLTIKESYAQCDSWDYPHMG